MIPDQFRLIATSAPLVRAAGPSAAIWIGNAISAQDWSEKACNESWWWATKVEIEERTGLSDEMQETTRKRLRDLGVLEERRGVLTRGASLATIWYRLDMEKLSEIVYRESRQSNTGLPGKRMPTNPANDHTSLTSSLTSEQQQPPLSPKGKRFVPPTEPEWVAYCEQTWADWHQECAADAWAYYESKGWKIGSATCKDWKAAARTAHGNARAWGKLQPVAGATRPTNSPGSPPPPRQMTPEEQRRLRGHRMDLERAERDLRVARNNPHNYDVDEARRKVDEVKARILKMGADPDEKGKGE